MHEEKQLFVQTLVGVYEWERAALRPLVLSLQLHSGEPLNLSRVLIHQQLTTWLAPCRYRLLEALAEHLTQQMFAAWSCQKIVLEMEKPGALGDIARVGVCITRVRCHAAQHANFVALS
ncbi:MAG: dihydroneopterin aldolase [Sideroxydans sp.]|nr:dihydroneopterin aldolase [Sideroxydans sp.]